MFLNQTLSISQAALVLKTNCQNVFGLGHLLAPVVHLEL